MKSYKEFCDEEFDNKIEKHQVLSHGLKENIFKMLNESDPDDVDAFCYILYNEYVESDDDFNIDEVYFTLDDAKDLVNDLCDFFADDVDAFLNSAYSILNNIKNDSDSLNDFDEYEDIDIDESIINEKPRRAVRLSTANKNKFTPMTNGLRKRELVIHRNKEKRNIQNRIKRHKYYVQNKNAKISYGKSYSKLKKNKKIFAKRRLK